MNEDKRNDQQQGQGRKLDDKQQQQQQRPEQQEPQGPQKNAQPVPSREDDRNS